MRFRSLSVLLVACGLVAAPALAQDVPLPMPKPAKLAATTAATAATAKPPAKDDDAKAPDPQSEAAADLATLEQDFGWKIVVDPLTGMRIGLPTRLVPLAREGKNGTRWSSRHGDVQVETFRLGNADLAALFAREKSEPSERRTEYSVLRGDSFFISGLQGQKKFSVRAQLRDGEVRGFTLMYDQAMEGIVAPVMVAMASAFAPFPERAAPLAPLSKNVEYATGIVVSENGHVITDRHITEGCQVIVVSGVGNAERVAADPDSALALLRVYGARRLTPTGFADAPRNGDLSLVGIPDPRSQDGQQKRAEVQARLVDGNAIELRQPVPVAGFTGAAALDPQGRVLGMTEMRTAVLASVEPLAPPVRLIQAPAIRAFLVRNKVTPAEGAGSARDSVVRVICVRK